MLTQRLPYAPDRGDRIRAYHLMRTLAAGAEVHLVSLVHDTAEAARASELTGIAASVRVAPTPRLRNLAGAALALPTGRPLTHLLLDSPELAPAIADAVSRVDPEVVLAYGSGMMRLAMQPPLSGLPCVLDMVDADSAKWSALAAASPPPMRWIYEREARTLARFERAAMKHAHATLVVNERERALLRALDGGAPIHVAGNGIDIDAFARRGPPATRRRIVFCGVMNYTPNVQGAEFLATEVWPLVRAAHPDADLAIVGASPSPAVRRLADPRKGIEVTGTVPDVRPWLWESAAAAAPLHTARGIQNKVLEAIAAGLPSVVTSAVADGLPAEVLPACLVADTATRFAAGLSELLSVPSSERHRLASSAALSGLTWEERLREVPELLADALRA
jgi:sugar transferase (PEP-CTERM/EpsH1 system associated)